MTSNQKNWSVFISSVLLSGIPALAYLQLAGTSDETIRELLRVTARLAFLIYLVIFVARPLQQLVPTGATRILLSERRSLGISFAGVHTVHLAFIGYRLSQVPDVGFPPTTYVFGGLTYLFILLMLITSFDGPARAIGIRTWGRLHRTGLYWIGLVFVSTLVPESPDQLLRADYVTFVLLSATAVIVRLTAYFRNR